MTLEIPELCLVVLVGASGAGKSTFARRHFRATEVVSSDTCRALVADDENDQAASGDAFALLHALVGLRLRRGRLTVVDATNVQASARKGLLALSREHDCLAVAIVLDVPVAVSAARNAMRPEREFGERVIRHQHGELRRSLSALKHEGFSRVHVLRGPEAVEAAAISRVPLWCDRRSEHGPFDIVGDVHGCYDELCELLGRLGHHVDGPRTAPTVTPTPGRRVIFLGDLVDRGPDAPAVLRLVMGMVAAGTALCVPGNHEAKLLKWTRGKVSRLTHGLAATVEQLAAEPPEFTAEVAAFIDARVGHLVLDDGRLVVAHAGLPERYHGRASGRVRAFCLFGETTGETDEFGLPVRYDWAAAYRGAATVVYGHTPVPEPEWVNRTICIDTGCVFGGRLTALRYPERELVSVAAARTYYEPVRPLAPRRPSRPDDVFDLGDVAGRKVIATRLRGNVTIHEAYTAAALEVMSRFTIDPRWLVYLPPTMAPANTAPADTPLLERPDEAFADFRAAGVDRVVCEEKHMGSRAVLVLARDADAAARRFGVRDGRAGVVYTRTGRAFFARAGDEAAVVERVAAAIGRAGLWQSLATDWVCLDAEVMPWSLKAQELVRNQYARVSAAASASLAAATEVLARAVARDPSATDLLARMRGRAADVAAYRRAWQRYCWDVAGIDDLRIAPFQILASEGRTWLEASHVWHMQQLAALAEHDPLLIATRFRSVDLDDAEACAAASLWWGELTASGSEGMVVKPEQGLVRGPKGLVQPALKCRGREYLRLIYGPEYTAPEHLERLRARGLGRKRGLALRELALGVEGLTRFVEAEPLWRVHECVFGVLALESEPVDPRL